MNFLEIRDIGSGQVQIRYPEDYLLFPYGTEEWHAQEVEMKLAAWVIKNDYF